MKRYLNLNDRAFNAIKNKTKRIEIRANIAIRIIVNLK